MNLTAIIINFLREPYLYTCIESLRKYYPDIKIIVGENGKYSNAKKYKLERLGCKYVNIGWDAGICVARNKLVQMVETDYVLVGDDDFKYRDDSNLDKMVKFLSKNRAYSLIGGRIIEKGEVKNYQGFFEFEYNDEGKQGLVYSKLDLSDYKEDVLRYKDCDITFNFFVGRVSDIKETRWDESIKVAYEHSSFFIDLKGSNKKVAFTPDCFVEHKPKLARNYPFPNYAKFRLRKSDKDTFFQRHDITWAKDMNGFLDLYENSNTDTSV